MRFLLLILILLTPATLAAQPAAWNDGAPAPVAAEQSPVGSYLVPFASLGNSPTTTIGYALPADGHVSLRVYDVKVVLEFSV